MNALFRKNKIRLKEFDIIKDPVELTEGPMLVMDPIGLSPCVQMFSFFETINKLIEDS